MTSSSQYLLLSKNSLQLYPKNSRILSGIKYFTPREISLHITLDDLWVSCFGKVFDLSPLCTDLSDDDDRVFALLAFAGKDVSHLFDKDGEVKVHVDPDTNKISPFLPFKSFLGAPTQEYAEQLFLKRKELNEKRADALAQKYRCQRLNWNLPKSTEKSSDEEQKTELPWWKDDRYVIGYLTKKPRWIKILNTMIMKDVTLEVCSEETIEDILMRYLKFNSNATSYTWKYLEEVLDMNLSLEMNGIPDHDETADLLRLKSENFIPTINLYYNHDLKGM